MDQREITIYSKLWCPNCRRAKRLLKRKGYRFETVYVTGDDGSRAQLVEVTAREKVPLVFVDGRLVSGFGEVKAFDRSDDLDRLVWGEV